MKLTNCGGESGKKKKKSLIWVDQVGGVDPSEKAIDSKCKAKTKNKKTNKDKKLNKRSKKGQKIKANRPTHFEGTIPNDQIIKSYNSKEITN